MCTITFNVSGGAPESPSSTLYTLRQLKRISAVKMILFSLLAHCAFLISRRRVTKCDHPSAWGYTFLFHLLSLHKEKGLLFQGNYFNTRCVPKKKTWNEFLVQNDFTNVHRHVNKLTAALGILAESSLIFFFGWGWTGNLLVQKFQKGRHRVHFSEDL